jgi:hypothetical protein
MTESLDCQFEIALRKKDYWGVAEARNLLAEFRTRIGDSQIDWEEDDENWARLVKNGEVILLVNALIPLTFVLSSYCDALLDVLGDCVAVPVESFSAESFSVSRQLMEQVVGREVSTNVNYDQLSIDDLWWATV